MKIKSIYIDGLHSVQNKTYTFEDITYLFGRNGAGKSTVLQAIQFVLLGYIPGSKTKAAKLRHARDGRIHVKATLIDDSGSEVILERVLTDTIDMFNTTPENYDITLVIAELELPIFNFDEFVGQTANKLKDYFIKNILPVQDGVINWEELLTNAIKKQDLDNKNEIIKHGVSLVSDLAGSSLDQAVSANEIFKNESTAIKRELDNLQGAIDSLIFYDDYTGPTNIAALDDQIRELSLLKDSVIAYKTSEMQATNIQTKLQAAKTELASLTVTNSKNDLVAEFNTAVKSLDDLTTTIKELTAAGQDLDHKINAMRNILTSKGVCVYTKLPCDTMAAKCVEVQSELGHIGQERMKLRNALDRRYKEYNDLEAVKKDLNDRIQRIDALTSQIDGLESMVVSLPTKPNTDKTDIELAQEIKSVQDSKMKAFANQQYNATIDELTRKKFQLELELAVYKAWVKKTDVNDLQTQIMQQPFRELADKMTGYIQTMYGNDNLQANFNVEAKANSFSFGLIRDGKYIPYDLLSSGEKCLYTLALMICIIDNSKSPLKVVLLDDALDNLDDIAIENTFKALKNIQDIQFILAGVKHSDNAEDVVVEVG